MAKELLTVPAKKIRFNKMDARKLTNLMKYYYLSPVFLLVGGIRYRHLIEKKYDIEKNNFSRRDFIMNIITVPFADELIITAIFLLISYLMNTSWQKYVVSIFAAVIVCVIVNIVLFCLHDTEISYEKCIPCKNKKID